LARTSLSNWTRNLIMCRCGCIAGVDVHIIISVEGVAMDEDKVRAVLGWPLPTTVRAVHAFFWFGGLLRSNCKAVNPATTQGCIQVVTGGFIGVSCPAMCPHIGACSQAAAILCLLHANSVQSGFNGQCLLILL
jgi:hypothetical protein